MNRTAKLEETLQADNWSKAANGQKYSMTVLAAVAGLSLLYLGGLNT